MPAIEPPKSFFSGVNTAKAMRDANYIRSGHYFMLILKCKIDETRRKEKFAANEFAVVHVFDDDKGMGHRVGEEVTHFISNYGAQADYFLGTVNGFISAAIGCMPEDVTEELCNGVYDPQKQPLAGTVMEVACRQIMKQNKKPEEKDAYFTRVAYRRSVPFAEVMGTISAEAKARLFPGDTLEKCVEAEAAQKAK